MAYETSPTKASSRATSADLAFHPFADLFPLLDDKALADLAADIKAQSQREPIFVWQGQIIDGRNRYRACKLARVEPVLKRIEFPGGDAEALAYVVSKNLKRRHMSLPERSIIAAKIAQLSKGRPDQIGPGTDLKTQAQVADILDVSVTSVGRAKAVIDLAPGLLNRVRDGELSLRQAADIARHGEPPETEAPEPEPEPEPDGVAVAKEAVANAEASRATSAAFIDRDTARLIAVITGRGQTTERLLDALSEGDIIGFLERKRARMRAA